MTSAARSGKLKRNKPATNLGADREKIVAMPRLKFRVTVARNRTTALPIGAPLGTRARSLQKPLSFDNATKSSEVTNWFYDVISRTRPATREKRFL